MGRKDKDKAKEVKNKQQIFNDDVDGESDEGDETGNDKVRVCVCRWIEAKMSTASG